MALSESSKFQKEVETLRGTLDEKERECQELQQEIDRLENELLKWAKSNHIVDTNPPLNHHNRNGSWSREVNELEWYNIPDTKDDSRVCTSSSSSSFSSSSF